MYRASAHQIILFVFTLMIYPSVDKIMVVIGNNVTNSGQQFPAPAKPTQRYLNKATQAVTSSKNKTIQPDIGNNITNSSQQLLTPNNITRGNLNTTANAHSVNKTNLGNAINKTIQPVVGNNVTNSSQKIPIPNNSTQSSLMETMQHFKIPDYITRESLKETSREADWQVMLQEAKDEHVGAYDSGTLKNNLWEPWEAFINSKAKIYYFDDSGSCDDSAGKACDPNGEKPCCSPFGWCGYSNEHCNCPMTLIGNGEKEAACVDYSRIKSAIRPKGYHSTWQSGPNEIPIRIFWRFPRRVVIHAFQFRKSFETASRPTEFEVQGSNDSQCWNGTGTSTWTSFFEGEPLMFGSNNIFEGDIELQRLRLAYCIGILIIKTLSNKASLDSIRFWYYNLPEAQLEEILAKIHLRPVSTADVRPISNVVHPTSNHFPPGMGKGFFYNDTSHASQNESSRRGAAEEDGKITESILLFILLLLLLCAGIYFGLYISGRVDCCCSNLVNHNKNRDWNRSTHRNPYKRLQGSIEKSSSSSIIEIERDHCNWSLRVNCAPKSLSKTILPPG